MIKVVAASFLTESQQSYCTAVQLNKQPRVISTVVEQEIMT